MIGPGQITGLVLAGGRGNRMGGVDKGLQVLADRPLVLHALERLRGQRGGLLGPLAINANRHLDAYGAFGLPVWPDTVPGHAGPLAGFLAGLVHCTTPWLLAVPCDCPRFPTDLAERLAHACRHGDVDVALPVTPDDAGRLVPQPVFCLLRVGLRDDLARFLSEGGRKTRLWAERHRLALVPFDRSGDDPGAFANVNTLADLRMLDNA